jgi:hypothetical protein
MLTGPTIDKMDFDDEKQKFVFFFLVNTYVFFRFFNSAGYNTAEGICSAREEKVRSLSTIGAR